MKQVVKPEIETEKGLERLSVRKRLPLSLFRVRSVLMAAGLAVAVALGIRASLLLHDPQMRRFDEALVLYGIALLGLLVFATVSLPRPRWGWRPRIARFWSGHRLEVVLLTAIVGFAVFMRVYKLGVFPPGDALSFEEGINGGVAYNILQGARPLFYPVRYMVAVSMAVFGENTFGLRFAGIAMGILIVPALYLLLRRLVSVPVALFVTALLAGAFWPSLHYRVTADAALFTILLALCMVAGVQRRSAVLFVLAGVLAGLLSYEYEAFKPVPFYVVGFLAAAALWLLSSTLVREGRTKTVLALTAGVKLAWRPAIAFVVAGGIVAGPLIMGEHLGRDLYFSSVHRQEGDRENRGTPGLFAPDWETQAKWAAELFAPFGPDEYRRRVPVTPPNGALIDPVSSVLLVVGLSWTLLTLLRPYRLFFAGWFLATLTGGALLLSNWEAWKFVGLLPVGLVMTAFLVDDVRSALRRLIPRRRLATGAFALALIVVAAYSWTWNARVFFNDVVTEPAMLRGYAHPQSYWYALCDYLRGRGSDNFSYSFHSRSPHLGFALPRDIPAQERTAWGDNIWVCHDLQGAALTGPLEAWPLRNAPSGAITLAYVIPPDLLEDVQLNLAWAYPELRPDEVKPGPEKLYYLVGYSLTSEEIRARQGLLAEYTFGGKSEAKLQRLDKPHRLSWDDEQTPQSPFTVNWRGLVFLNAPGPWSLRAKSDDTTRIAIDGGQPYEASAPLDPGGVPYLAAGWHWVEIILDKELPGGDLMLSWQSADGAVKLLEEQDLFALEPRRGWLHTRTFEIEGLGEFTTQRPESDVGQGVLGLLLDETSALAQQSAEPGETIKRDQVRLVEERFAATWRVPVNGDFALTLQSEGGEAAILIDGQEVEQCTAQARNTLTYCNVQEWLAAGEHRVELVLKTDSDLWTGGRLTVAGPSTEKLEIVPF